MKIPYRENTLGGGIMLWVQFEGQDVVLFNPTSNMRDAWIVVEELSKNSDFDLSKDCDDSYFRCEFLLTTSEFYISRADTAPMAICLAALKAVGVDING